MSRDFDDIYKKIDQSHKELYKQETDISKEVDVINKNQDKIIKDIIDIKKQIKDINYKVDLMLEILNNFTVMLTEEEEEDCEDYSSPYDSDQTWVPEDSDENLDDHDEWGDSIDES